MGTRDRNVEVRDRLTLAQLRDDDRTCSPNAKLPHAGQSERSAQALRNACLLLAGRRNCRLNHARFQSTS